MTVDREVAVLPSNPPELLEVGCGVGVVNSVENGAADPFKPHPAKFLDLGSLVGTDFGRCSVDHRDAGRSSSLRGIRTEGMRVF